MKKIILIFISFFALNLSAKDLVVGMELGYPPFEMSDKTGKASGISVDFLEAFAKKNGYKLVVKNTAWDGLIPALKTAKIDLIMSSMTITDERKKVVDFSIPYAKANLAILTPLNSDIANIKDLDKKGKVLALKRGSTGHLYAVKNLKNATINLFDKENAAILEVIQGKADGFFYDQLTIYRTWQKHQDTTRAILAPFQENSEFWGIAVQKGNAELKKELDEFIAESKKDGFFDSLGEKYLKDVKDTFKKNNLEFFF
ncbi:transporter substrate-binding domain-containing protein [Campylobacter jejuni]|uniref:transporter substrate-binding domain-containing protein n=1 Tax=Campylobacter jejuni TaxID=197 RepID=UPI0008739B7C|nr:transporter substrate-binding domain-containing protein [Campylobacter jejuni]EAH7046309.1 transporter substrate-binding domain-containing protein [Campylobacter jejuni]EEA8494087.1 transporter substrate-binding domain-containing protein [Campylobacter jejuni]ELT5475916.1 transporter substrate-binding domain-containing protein [Campylobacter jejuni]MBX0418677.1 transporter substrate-binding domain-containing protein [Campylobacter jejuni]MBX0469390.1 transporter substrate-binding domain-con